MRTISARPVAVRLGPPVPDSFIWHSPTGGDWRTLSNWTDTASGGKQPMALPTATDRVTILEAAYQTITGTGVSASLALLGKVALGGQFSTGVVNVTAMVDIVAGGALSARTANVGFGAVAVTGGSFLVSGGTVLHATISALSGATFQTGALSLAGGTLVVDATSTAEIGAAGGAAAGLLTVDAGARLTVSGTATLTTAVQDAGSITGTGGTLELGALSGSGSLSARGANAQVTTTGTLILDDSASLPGMLQASAGARIRVGALQLQAASSGTYADLVVDGTSSIEIGTAGGAAAGAITIDQGSTLGLVQGPAELDLHGSLVDNGMLIDGMTGGISIARTMWVDGDVSGTGSLQIGSFDLLVLSGTVAATNSIQFLGGKGTLDLAPPVGSPAYPQVQATISGLVATDVIDVAGAGAGASVSYAPTGNGLGTVTLTANGAMAEILVLAGDYSTSLFLALPDAGTGTEILVAPVVPGAVASTGTSGADVYTWDGLAPRSANWGAAQNWDDISAGQYGANVAPGVNDFVTIGAPQSPGAYQVVTGPGVSAGLTLIGGVVLDGSFSTGALSVSTVIGNAVTAYVDGGTLAASSLTMQTGALSVLGPVSSLLVSGASSLGGLTGNASLSATAGGVVQLAGGLTMQDVTLTADATSSIEVGAVGGGTAGYVTVDAGSTLVAQNATISAVVDNGGIAASGGVTITAAVLGVGSLSIAANSILGLEGNVSAQNQISFLGSNAELDISAKMTEAAPLSGFAAGDTIGISDLPFTQASLSFAGWAGGGILSVTDGVDHAELTLVGHYIGADFHIGSLGNGGTAITYGGLHA